METMRKYPVGIQTFSEIRKGNYVYIDKTDLVWNMTQMKYVFLSRPRRFGKSLLTTTLASYFKGEKQYFEGLKIMDLETEWEQYPVIHIDLSLAKNQPTAEDLQKTILYLIEPLVEEYGKTDMEIQPGQQLRGIIRRAYEKTGKQVAVIIDEYDAPLLDVLSRGGTSPRVSPRDAGVLPAAQGERGYDQVLLHYGHYEVQPAEYLLHHQQPHQHLDAARVLRHLRHHRGGICHCDGTGHRDAGETL